MSGSALGGFSTMLQPTAMAGATLWAARFSGKLNGLIPEDRTDGKSLGDAEATFARCCKVKRNRLADHSFRLFGG